MTTRYVPPRARAWLLAHLHVDAREAARALGVTISTVRTYRSRLIAAGLLDRRGMAAKLCAVRDGIREGRKVRALAADLGVHPGTVTWRLRRLNQTAYDTRREHVYSGRELAALFGYAPDSGGSYRWLVRLQAAGLTGRHPGKYRHWRVTAEELMRFLESPASWRLIKLKRIADPDWRAYAEQARARAFTATTKRTRKKATS